MNKSRMPRVVPKYRHLYVLLFSVIAVGVIVTGVYQFWPQKHESAARTKRGIPGVRKLEINNEAVVIKSKSRLPEKTDQSCLYHTCFDVYHCGGAVDETHIKVYIYPVTRYVDENGVGITLPLSREFWEILEAILNSDYYTNDPNEACLYIPSIDLLNQNNIRTHEIAQVLNSLPM